jgi:glycosyltransferase involved in cell wall biosynthesis
MRIFVPSAASLLTDHRGHGEGLIAWSLLSGLSARGHELVVCAREVDLHSNPPFEVIETGPASRWESIEPLRYASATRRRFEQLGGRQRFDLAHWLFPQGSEEALIRLPGIPMVLGPLFLEWPTQRRVVTVGELVRVAARPAFGLRHWRTLEDATTLIVSIPAAVETVPPRFRVKVRNLPCGVDAEKFSPSPLPAIPTVLYVGKLEPVKGVRELVEAFARTRREVPNARLILAGGGSDRAAVVAAAERLQLGPSFELVGHVPHDELPALFASSSLLCLPSHGEPYGMAALEAMASGRAVVAVDEAGPTFLVDRALGGRLVPRSNVAELSRALTELLSDPGPLEAMGRHNRQRVEKELSWPAVLSRLERVYEDAVANSLRRTGGSGAR